ncbi:MAG: hypothetical protein JSS02_20460, partial [Planctomycetes bacterium]|nr:hypothetical protein [Planctomycetota bacterium]
MLLSLALPIVLSAIALFFTSFLSWMILELHKHDWKKLDKEDAFLAGAAQCELTPGNYMFPGCSSHAEARSEEFQKKYAAGPRGCLTVLPVTNMGKNLGLTFLYFLVVSTLLGYLGTIAFQPGAKFLEVFRLFSTAALLTFLSGIIQHSIWFRVRVVGHIIESVLYAAVTATIFASLWPG